MFFKKLLTSSKENTLSLRLTKHMSVEISRIMSYTPRAAASMHRASWHTSAPILHELFTHLSGLLLESKVPHLSHFQLLQARTTKGCVHRRSLMHVCLVQERGRKTKATQRLVFPKSHQVAHLPHPNSGQKMFFFSYQF